MAQIDPQQAIREEGRRIVEGFAPEQVRPFPKSHDLLESFRRLMIMIKKVESINS